MKKSLVAFVARILPAFLLFLSIQTSQAGSATWLSNPGSGDWNTNANWNPNTGFPGITGISDVATFDVSNTTAVSLSGNADVAQIIFDSGASAFTITVNPIATLTIGGTGITNSSGITQNFVTDVNGSGGQGAIVFSNSATAGSMSVTPDPAAPGATGSVSSFSVSGSKVTVNLTGVSNAQTVRITLSGVSDGTNTNDVSVPMGVLLGDINGDRSVTSSGTSNDVTLTQSKVGQTTGSTNFREDVNLDGSITSTDVNVVQSEVGTSLP